MEKLLPKGFLAFGGSLFFTASFFHSYIWRAAYWLFEADGRIFFSGDFPNLYQHCVLFSDIIIVTQACDGISVDFDDVGTVCGGRCVDLYPPCPT